MTSDELLKEQDTPPIADPHPNGILVVLDPLFGERVQELWRGQAVWVLMTRVNAPAVRKLSKAAKGSDQPLSVLGIRCRNGRTPEECFVTAITTIDPDHTSYARSPCAEMIVIGAKPTASIADALSDSGFSICYRTQRGFVARRKSY